MTRVIVAGNDPDIRKAISKENMDVVDENECRKDPVPVPVLEPYMRMFNDSRQMFDLTDTAVPSGGMASFGMKYSHSRKAKSKRRKR